MMQNIINTTISAVTIVAPTGVENRMDNIIPVPAQITDMTAEQMITLLKLWNTRIAESAGKIINAEISREPTKFMAMTIIKAVMTAIMRL